MGLIDNVKKFVSSIGEPKTEEYQEYKKFLDYSKNELNRFQGYIDKYSQIVDDCEKKGVDKEDFTYKDAREQLSRWKYSLMQEQRRIKFIRPNTKEDIDYRNKQLNEFVNNLRAVKSENLDIRFHGTPIYFAEDIIKSGNISSSADRFDGYMTSTDLHGEISASNIDSLSRTIDFFSDMVSYNSNLPCGCVFALKPKDEHDATLGHDIMQAVSFNDNPEQLYGIFTTPENVPNVQKWMEECGFCKDKVYTFDDFVKVVEKDSQEIDKEMQKKNDMLKREANKIIIDEDSILKEARSQINSLDENILVQNQDDMSRD